MRVTFLAPHLSRNSGGVYAIEQIAGELSRRRDTQVTVAVAKRELRPIRAATVVAAPRHAPEHLPPADALLVLADAPHPERLFALPADRGTRVVLLQGYGEPGNPAVTAALELGDRVLTGASWLDAAARAHGCRVGRFRYGLDPDIFFAGPPVAEREPVVSMIVGVPAWKGAEDGIAALTLVREARPHAEFVLVGRERPEAADALGASWLAAPPSGRWQIAELLRRSAVFVCPSWEEGYGLPGVEALACGAALATTDTKGSRDYARPNETALVVEPRRPELLAEAILALLDSPTQSAALVARGQAQVLAAHPPWTETAGEFMQALKALL